MSIEEDKKKYLQSCVLVPDEDWRPFGVPAFIYSREAPSFAHPRPARSGRHPFSLKLFVFLSWETLQPLFCLFIYWLHYHISVSLWALFSLFFSRSCLLLAVMLVPLFLFYSSLLSHFIFHFASSSSLFLSSYLSVYCVLFRVCFFVSSFPYILHVIFSVLFRCPYFNANISVLLICVSFFVCVCLSVFFFM